jgi:hypothetical protein
VSGKKFMIPVTYKSEMEGYKMPRGGKREGAGRPKGNPDDVFRRVSITLSGAALVAFDDFAAKNKLSRSAAIEKLALAGLKKGL